MLPLHAILSYPFVVSGFLSPGLPCCEGVLCLLDMIYLLAQAANTH